MPPRKSFTYPKSLRGKSDGASVRLWNSREQNSYQKSRDRWSRRHYDNPAIEFGKYDLATNGILYSKPHVAYDVELSGRKPKPYFMGLEIELENHRDNIRLASKLNHYWPKSAYVCTDGSLRNSGIEIVSAPRGPAELIQNYHNLYLLLHSLSRMGYTAHDNTRCGLHVHVSRGAMTEAQWRKLESFVLKYKKLFMHLSRRESFQYCEFKRNRQGQRYNAVNFSNIPTVEFRFFRGTLKPETFFASLEIIMLLVNYFREHTSTRVNFKSFINYVSTSKLKFGSKFMLGACEVLGDQLPTTSRRLALTPEQRADRAASRETARAERASRMTAELTRIVERAQRYIPGVRHGVDPATIQTINVPLRLSGYNAPLRAAAAAQIPTVSMSIVIGDRIPRVIHGRRRTSWGNTSERYWPEY